MNAQEYNSIRLLVSKGNIVLDRLLQYLRICHDLDNEVQTSTIAK